MYPKNKLITFLVFSSAVSFASFADTGSSSSTQSSEIHAVVELNTASYREGSAEEKRACLWEEIKKTTYDPLLGLSKPSRFGLLGSFWNVFRQGKAAFDTDQDMRLEPKPKPIHKEGIVGLVRLQPSADYYPFTGLYKENSIGLMRLSSVASPGPDQTGDFQPSIALKFFVDGQPSRNLHTAPVTAPDPAHNAFSVEMSTDIDLSKQPGVVQLFFRLLTKINAPSNRIAPKPLAEVSMRGENVEEPLSPEIITFVPTDAARTLANTNTHKDFRADLAEYMSAGTVLYNVYGLYENNNYYIGQLVLEESFRASFFGDQHLFFQHNRAKKTDD